MIRKREWVPGYLVRLSIIFAAYFVTARFGLKLNAVSGFATLVWPPTGIAIASLYILGRRYWPAILLAAFSVNFVTGAEPTVALGIGFGNMLEAFVAVTLIRAVHVDPLLNKLRDVINFILLAAIVSTIISATIGTTSLLFGGIVSFHTFENTWLAWWIGDALGALIIAPLFFVWSRASSVSLNRKQIFEAAASALILATLCLLTFHGAIALGKSPSTFTFLLFPVLIYISVRFGQVGSVSATFVVAIISIWHTVIAFNRSGGDSLSQHLLPLQILIGVIAVTFLVFAAVNSERERAQKLHVELAVHNARLSEESSRLKALNAAKDDFIAVASHQLRTPATSVKQYVGMLVEGRAGTLNPKQAEIASKAYESNERQLHIIGQLLKVARIDSGQINLDKSRVDIIGLIHKLLGSGMAESVAARGQTIQFVHNTRKKYVQIDEGKIRMAIENIIDNASKYSPSGKPVEISVAKGNPAVIITIKDHGIGIAKKDIPKIFNKFTRIENKHSIDVGGTGLGLYWAKKVIDLHGGSIDVVSKPGNGTTFSISLPVVKN